MTISPKNLINALEGRLSDEDQKLLIQELQELLKLSPKSLDVLTKTNIRIKGDGNIVNGNNNTVILVRGKYAGELKSLLSNLYDRHVNDLSGKLHGYIVNLINDEEFSDWDQRRYFELRVGRERKTDLDIIRMRVKVSRKSTATNHKDKYKVNDAIEQFRHLVIIGDPGSGKTTALRCMALNFASEFQNAIQAGLQCVTKPLPIYIWLPQFNLIAGTTPYDRILALIRDAFQRLGTSLSNEEIEFLLQRYQIALLLDGLNEIGDKNTTLFLNALTTYASIHQQHLIVITSRIHNFQFTAQQDLTVLELLELNYPDDIRQYLCCYLDSSEVRLLMGIFESNFQLRRLAVNPLLLWMIIQLFQFDRGRIPNSRGQLFDGIAHGLLGRWRLPTDRRRPTRYWIEDKHVLLKRLGYAMKDEGLELSIDRAIEIFKDVVITKANYFSSKNKSCPSPYIPLGTNTNWEELIDELKAYRVLVQTRDTDKVRFWHQTIQEYFASYYIWDQIRPLFERNRVQSRSDREDGKLLEHKLKGYIADRKWHEILAIACGLIVGKGGSQESTAAQMVIKFIDKIWEIDPHLAAMCINNVEKFDDNARLAGYMRHFRREIHLWGIVLPRFYPWLLIAGFIAGIWLIPQKGIMSLFNIVRDSLNLSALSLLVGSFGFSVIFGSVVALLFFRLYTIGIQKFETFTNERYIRPGISALRYIRNEEAERLLSEFKNRIANDFSIGDTTRFTIETGLVPPVRDESELILMLENSRTRLQAIQHLAERGTERATDALVKLMDQADLDELSYKTVIRSLVDIVKLQPIGSMNRLLLESKLRETLSNSQNSFKRHSAYETLLNLGITDVRQPKMYVIRHILTMHWPFAVGISLLLVLMLMLGYIVG